MPSLFELVGGDEGIEKLRVMAVNAGETFANSTIGKVEMDLKPKVLDPAEVMLNRVVDRAAGVFKKVLNDWRDETLARLALLGTKPKP